MTIIDDDHKMLNHYLNLNLFNNEYYNTIFDKSKTTVELIIRPDCNQKCKYCYLTQHGKDLYPKHLRPNNDVLLNNIKQLFSYFLQRQCYIKTLDLFAGDLFYDNLFFPLMDVIYDYYKTIYELNPNMFLNKDPDIVEINAPPSFQNKGIIIIPCNFSFCHDEEKIKKFEEVYNKFYQINIKIFLSYSSDGPYSYEVREGKALDDVFINNVFNLIKKYEFSSHPMIAYENIDYAIDNYKWWREQYKKYDFGNSIMPTTLEVRNEGWTQESIDKYLEYLQYMIEDRIKIHNGNLEETALDLFCHNLKTKENIIKGPDYMDPIKFTFHDRQTNNEMSCTLGTSFAIYCGDLTLVPCHRLSYPMFKGGQFISDGEKIIEIKALNNVNGYLNQIQANRYFSPGCSTCEYRDLCMKGCRGAQFEANCDPNIPIPDVCELFKQKINFLLKSYSKIGLLKIGYEKKYFTPIEIISFNNILKMLGEPTLC